MYMLVMQAMAAEEIWMDKPISPVLAEEIAEEMEV
jgi:shikimate 5-dehydrogenase